MFSALREQELIYIKENEMCNNGYERDCEKLHTYIGAPLLGFEEQAS
jgi:hypothetical protein